MNVTSRTGIKVLVATVGLGVAGAVAERHLAASPLPVNSTKADSPPRVEVVRPRRMAQRLQTNATLEAFKQTERLYRLAGYRPGRSGIPETTVVAPRARAVSIWGGSLR
jgi:hypothetical protein